MRFTPSRPSRMTSGGIGGSLEKSRNPIAMGWKPPSAFNRLVRSG